MTRGRARSRERWRSVLGVMSGTSVDGVDCVRVEFRNGRPGLGEFWWRPFPTALRRRLLACAGDELSSWETGQLHHELGRFYARAVMEGLGRARVDAVGLHGQTVFHAGGGAKAATLQIGEPAYLAQAINAPVVSNFRAGDLAAGGEGAPMATLFHARVFACRGSHVCVQNLGGIGNVTSLDHRGARLRVMAFDTGPANMLLDAAARRVTSGKQWMDADGRMARAGRADARLVARWLRHSFFRKAPPKSTGRELFGAAYFERAWGEMERAGLGAADRVATFGELTVQSIAMAYRDHLGSAPDRVILCGGGARNPWLVERIREGLGRLFPRASITTCEEWGWPPETIEGAAFALLARERLLERPGNVPEATGAREARCCGQVTWP